MYHVALRKESVDRNRVCTTTITICTASLSARRAWIEIEFPRLYKALSHVALRKESVDRNTNSLDDILAGVKSLSARRAWIEIPQLGR